MPADRVTPDPRQAATHPASESLCGELCRELARRLHGRRVCLLGVGNLMRGDDGAGSALVLRLRGAVGADCIDAGSAPENYLENVLARDPEVVMLIDAADLGRSPGDVALLGSGDLAGGGLSTHALSLQMTCEYLSARKPLNVFVLGIQPRSARFGEGLSREVANTVDALASFLSELLHLSPTPALTMLGSGL